MAYALITHTLIAGMAGALTTPGVDTTGVNLLVAHVARLTGTSMTLADSKSNTWTALTVKTDTGPDSLLYYSVPSSVGASHTFTINGTGSYFGSCEVQAWSGSTASPFGNENGNTTSNATSLQTGSITPPQDNCLVVTGFIGNNQTGVISINSSFTISDTAAFSTGVNYGSSMAYLVQTSAAAVNPTWSTVDTCGMALTIASFKPAAAAATAARRLTLLGVG